MMVSLDGSSHDDTGTSEGVDRGLLPDEPSDIPTAALRAMEDRMHSFRRLREDDPARVESGLGGDGTALYAIEDGDQNCMICRVVGEAADGCIYCLVGRIPAYRFEELEQGTADLQEAFDDAKEICLCSVFESDHLGANLFVVARYRNAADVPEEYLPPSPYIEFTDE